MSNMPPPGPPVQPPPPGDGPPPPPPSGGYGAPPPASPPSGGGGRGKLVAILAVAAVVIIAVVLVAVFALGGGDGDVELSDDELEDALLNAEEFGDDYTEEPHESNPLDPDDVDASDECIDLLEQTDTESESIGRDYNPAADGNPRFTESLTGTYEGRPDFSILRELVEQCDEYHVDDGESVGDASLSESDVDIELGDDTIVLEATVDVTEPYIGTVSTYVIYWERDGIYGSFEAAEGVVLRGRELETSPVDEDETVELAEAADEMLIEAIEEAG